jgi:hypothetical protein
MPRFAMASPAVDVLRQFDFSDGHPLNLSYDGRTLLLDYQDWRERVVSFRFEGVAFFSCFGGNASLCSAEILDDTPEIQKARESLAHDWGTWDYWKEKQLTQLVIRDDVPLLTVVFENVTFQVS